MIVEGDWLTLVPCHDCVTKNRVGLSQPSAGGCSWKGFALTRASTFSD